MTGSITYRWPDDRRIAVQFDICLEGWSDGKAPGITPMGNPLPPGPGVVDTMAISWAAYGVNVGVQRLADVFGKHDVAATILANGVIAERSPDVLKGLAEAGHEIAGHSWAMDQIPMMQTEEDEQANITRTKDILESASGHSVRGWISPRATPSPRTEHLLAAAGYGWHADVLDRDTPERRTTAGGEIVALPFHTEVNDMPLLKYGRAAVSMVEAFDECVAIAKSSETSSIVDVTLHAHIAGHERPAHYVEKIVAAAAGDSELWLCTRGQLAEYVVGQVD